jgi:two-component system NtrC family sensor kinase
MKKYIALLLLLSGIVSTTRAQQINLDSIEKVVIARNPRNAANAVLNKDSLFRQLTLAKPGAARVKLFYEIFNLYSGDKENIETGYRILSWAKTHHDLITQAVVLAEMGSTIATTGDKATAQQLEIDAMAAATQAGDKQALGIVYQNIFNRTDITQLQIKEYALKALKLSKAAGDTRRVGWEYVGLALYYSQIKKPDSAHFCIKQALDWGIRANSVYDICNNINYLSSFQKDKQLKEKYYRTAYRIATTTNNTFAISITAAVLGDHYAELKNIDSAFFYTRKAYLVSLPLTPDFQLGPAAQLARIYKQKRNIDSAIKYLGTYFKLREQLYNNESVVRAQAITFKQKEKQQQAEAQRAALKSSQQRWLMVLVMAFLLIIAFIFWRNSRQSRKANMLLTRQKLQTELALTDLKAAQTQLVQSEKMASLGELTAGIAHEIQNPLNFVNNFSEVSAELVDELNDELDRGDVEGAKAIATDIKQNLEKINHHGKRADNIVKGMLEHSRANTGQTQPTDFNKMADEYLRLAYNGLRVKDKDFNAEITTRFDEHLPKVNVIQQDMGRVLLNLFNNAFYAVNQKKKTAGPDYKPEVMVSTLTEDNRMVVTIRDNGMGIPDAIMDKIMQPFFTTKPTGQGTGLGLSLSYDIVVKGHGGRLTVTSEEGKYTEFRIAIPV